MERKDFLHLLGTSAVTLSISSLIESCSKTGASPAGNVDFNLDVSLSQNAVLLSDGGSLISNNVIIINLAGTYTALSSICTHERCSVGYNNGAGNLQCPCHGSEFATSGTVLRGPAQTSLKQYQVEKSGNILHIFG